ncbi:thiol:disulfide interchange protein DsbA [Pseudoduganella ginsengisoli]|uniref:Thiol:disulfide interchange protein n=1 Tax=Pseudoduganella ginsengisoli TaxID=1462440 RepID=A0A6L6Q1X1_9BURK|nr:thiol:disulfide interchange protein DsbA/DsbL [Pseudoduganella ginsengisoli]MTW03853.1 thioredoxin domain-containing protein [Pseudoduganella ginsengisoli]
MRLFHTAALAAALLSAGFALASPTAPRNGAEYQTLASPMPVAPAGKKVEVIEFFMYHCPACNALEPSLAAWVKKQGDNINFRRIHMPHMQNDPEAHLFLALEALQLDVSMHDKVLHTWHVERQRLRSDEDNIAWAVKQGIDKAKFMNAYTSFGVLTRLNNLDKLMASYKVDSTPTLVINGRYLTTPSMVIEANQDMPRASLDGATFQVADALVQKAQQEMAK